MATCFDCSYFDVLNWCRRNDFAVNPDDEACRFYIGINDMEEPEINEEEPDVIEKEEQPGGIYIELEEKEKQT